MGEEMHGFPLRSPKNEEGQNNTQGFLKVLGEERAVFPQ